MTARGMAYRGYRTLNYSPLKHLIRIQSKVKEMVIN